MFVITATFAAERAYAAINELLAMADSPDRLAEKLGLPLDVEMVQQGAAHASFKRIVADVKKLKHYREIGGQIESLKAGTSMARFLGSGFQDKQRAKLEAERKKFGSPLDAPAWFYRQPRVVLLSSIRDYALDLSLHDDAAWAEVEPAQLTFPIATMYESADVDFAEALVIELEKPLKKINPKFLLQNFEGHRSIAFDIEAGIATYYAPARKDA
jgi:hypothetical protein